MERLKSFVLIGIVLLLGVCTFYDLQISLKLFNDSSSYGKFFETFGEVPMTYIGCFSAAALFVTMKKTTSWFFYLAKIGFAVLELLFASFSAMMIGSHLSLSSWFLVIVAVGTGGACYLLARAVPAKHHYSLRQAAKVGLILAVSAILVITMLKMLWGRMRFRAMTDPITQFTSWYLPQSMTTTNNFMSFPSGHAANATVMIWISLLPTFVSPLVGKKNWLELIAFLWIILVMVSRIIMGAHFATDVIVGMLISLTLFFLLKKWLIAEDSRGDMLS